MRKLTDHIVEGDSANHQLTIKVLDEPGQGGACHLYRITGLNASSNPSEMAFYPSINNEQFLDVLFQNGPIREVGVNGITHEALLAILIDRLLSFQNGPYACAENGEALMYLRAALRSLQERTRLRIARNVEGTHEK